MCFKCTIFNFSCLSHNKTKDPGQTPRITLDSDIIWSCILTRAELNVDLYSLLLIDATAAVIRRGDLHCQVFMYCNVDCRGNFTL